MKIHDQLLQIAHMINQLVERTKQVVELLMEHSKETIVNLWKKMIAFMAIFSWEESTLQPCQSG